MATVTQGVSTGSTSGAATYTTASFTPAADDLLIGVFGISEESSTDWVPSDSQSGTWTHTGIRTVKNADDFLEVWVRDSVVAASAMTVTWSHASGNASGGALHVSRVAGLTRTGLSAILQTASQAEQAAGTTPAPTFGASVLTANATITGVHTSVNGGLNTFPASWTGLTNANYGTPANTVRQCQRASGFTGTTITWGSTVATGIWSSWAIELDGSAAPTGSLIWQPAPSSLYLR
jgi:hypothetical protein